MVEEEIPDFEFDNDINDMDNVTFLEPKRSDMKVYQEASQHIEAELMAHSTRETNFEEEEWTPVDTTKFNLSQDASRMNQSLILDTTKDLNLIESWNLPESTSNEYIRKGVERIFDWQSECLQNPKVLFDGKLTLFSNLWHSLIKLMF